MVRISSYFDTSTPTVPGDFLVCSAEGAPRAALSSSFLGLPHNMYRLRIYHDRFRHFNELLHAIIGIISIALLFVRPPCVALARC